MIDFKSYCVDQDETVQEQIDMIINHPAFDGEKVRLMPDAHAGAAGPIGFTGTFSDKIIPNIVGVDIACRVSAIQIPDSNFDMETFDKVVHSVVPTGFSVHDTAMIDNCQFDYSKLHCWNYITNHDRIYKSLGTLGGGNHYIAISQDKNGKRYLVIHCGSRNLGKQCAEYYQNIAVEKKVDDFISNQSAYIVGQDMENYLDDMRFINRWSRVNHDVIAANIFNGMGWSYDTDTMITNIHNYVDVDKNIVRKGAISAQANELCLIPLNMKDGTLLCRGKGNWDWNVSAPHGAGRTMSRGEARRTLSIEDFQKTMEGVYTTCVTQSTIDEAPMAYKDANKIINAIGDTCTIVDHWKEIYNFKAV